MSRSRALAIGVALAASLTLGACGDGDAGSDPGPSPSASASATPTGPGPSAAPTDALPQSAADLVGTWRDDAADWTVRFAADATYTVDYQGVEDFLRGSYRLEGDVLTLAGLDGNDQVGQVTADGLVFALGTLTPR